MYAWQEYLKGDPLPWLLEMENPSVRYWTLVDLLDRPAEDPEVLEVAPPHPRTAAGTGDLQPAASRGLLGRG